MKKFKNKATGVIYTVTTDAIIAQFERDSRYTEVKARGTSKGKAEEAKEEVAEETTEATEAEVEAENK